MSVTDSLKRLLTFGTGAVLPLRHAGDPVLEKKARKIAAVTPEIRDLAARMVATMRENRGVGLAAPQVGVSLRLIILGTHDPREPVPADATPGEHLLGARMPLALINPEIITASDELEASSEGCLSVPEISAEVVRPWAVVVRATTLDGEPFEVACGNLLSRCLQHEIDHLDGILFIDRLKKTETRRIKEEVEALRERTRRGLAAPRGKRRAL
jgi:peptide deformylase